MTIGALIFIVAIAGGVVLCALGKWLSRRKLLGGRQQLSIDETISGLPGQFDRNLAIETLQMLGRSFGVEPGLLRLDNPIAKLNALDSWSLGSGQEKFGRWLVTKGITTLETKPATIRDLALYVLSFKVTS